MNHTMTGAAERLCSTTYNILEPNAGKIPFRTAHSFLLNGYCVDVFLTYHMLNAYYTIAVRVDLNDFITPGSNSIDNQAIYNAAETLATTFLRHLRANGFNPPLNALTKLLLTKGTKP